MLFFTVFLALDPPSSKISIVIPILVVCTRLYKLLCQSVCLSVGRSVCLSLNAQSTRLMAIGLVLFPMKKYIQRRNKKMDGEHLKTQLDSQKCIFLADIGVFCIFKKYLDWVNCSQPPQNASLSVHTSYLHIYFTIFIL